MVPRATEGDPTVTYDELVISTSSVPAVIVCWKLEVSAARTKLAPEATKTKINPRVKVFFKENFEIIK